MEAIIVPADRAFVTQRVTLDGAEYVLTLKWLERVEKWTLYLADQDEVPILSGVKVVADYPLLTLCKHDARCPPGQLMASDSSKQGLDPHFSDMSGDAPRVLLVYVPAAEL